MPLDLIWAVKLKKKIKYHYCSLNLGHWDVDAWGAVKKVTGWTSKWSPVVWISQVIFKDRKVEQRKVGWYQQMRLERWRCHHRGPCVQLSQFSKVQKIVPGLLNCATCTPVQVCQTGLSCSSGYLHQSVCLSTLPLGPCFCPSAVWEMHTILLHILVPRSYFCLIEHANVSFPSFPYCILETKSV